MNDEAGSLSAVWMSDRPVARERVAPTIEAVLARDRTEHEHDHRVRVGALLALTLLLPVLLWSAAHGVTPLVRGAYALMSVGSAMIVAAEWIYLEWSRQALPGPVDARTQLQKAALMLTRQAMLLRMGPIWSAPVFIGGALIGLWLYRDRTHAAAFVVWTITLAGWVAAVVGTTFVRARLHPRRQQIERLLRELNE